ncbi:MAG: LysR family transcriptional regulator [Gammaproteobacteria bacterium]|nr:LysR family transcriptional regulator [Gammaproteobacteria bacterium]
MKLRYPPLNELKTFHAVAQAGRFSKAAALLSVTESAVSHQIRRLEQRLGVRLFEKNGREMHLSAAGAKYFQAVRLALETLSEATEELAGTPARGRATLTLPTSLAAFWLIPRLSDLHQQHPDLSLQLITTNRLCDFDRENIDLGIRYGYGDWSGYDITKLMPEVLLPVAAESYLKKWRDAPMAKVLAEAKIIVNTYDTNEWKDWCEAHGLPVPPEQRTVTFEGSELVLQAAMEGVGIAMGRQPLVDRLIRSGKLMAPFINVSIESAAYYLIHRKGTMLSGSALKVADWLKEQAIGHTSK